MVNAPGNPAPAQDGITRNAQGIPSIIIGGGQAVPPTEHLVDSLDAGTPAQSLPEEVQVAANTDTANDAEDTFLKAKKNQAFEDAVAANKARLAGANASPAPETKKPVDPQDPLDISLGGISRDIGQGIVESPVQILGGIRDAGQETLVAMDSLGNWLNENVMDLSIPGMEGSKLNLPEVSAAESNTGNLIRGAAQFATGFIPALKGVKAISGGAAISKIGTIAQFETAAAAATATVFDPHESRLSNLIQSTKGTKFDISNPVNEYLMAKDEDGQAFGRMKNAIEGLGLGIVTEGLLKGIRVIKANRVQKGITLKDVGLGDPEARPNSAFGDPKAPFMSQEGADLVTSGKATPEALAPHINFAGFTDEAAISKAVDRLAKAAKATAPKESGGMGRTSVVGDAEVKRLAENLGVTPEDLLGQQKFLNGNRAIDAERIHAINTILDAATINLQQMAKVAGESTDDALVRDYLAMLNAHAGIQLWAKGYAAEAGRALRAFQIPTGSLNKQIAEIHEQLMQNGGPDAVRRSARIIGQMNSVEAINKAAAKAAGSTLGQAVQAMWYFDLLSGMTSHAANALGNAAMITWAIPQRYLAEGIAGLRGAQFGVEQGEASAMVRGVLSSLTDGVRIFGKDRRFDPSFKLPPAFAAAWKTLKTGEVTDKVTGKALPGKGRVITAEKFRMSGSETHPTINAANYGLNGPQDSMMWYMGKAVDALGSLLSSPKSFAAGMVNTAGVMVDAPTRMLATVDELFRTITKTAQLNALALRKAAQEDNLVGPMAAGRIKELLENPTSDMVKSAVDFSREMTLNTPPGPIGRSIEDVFTKIPFGKVLVPFFRVINNMNKWSGTNSPVGWMAKSVRDKVAAGGPAGDLAISGMAMGSLMTLTFADEAWKGNITGAGPNDPTLRENWLRNHKPFSFKIGDEWYQWSRVSPMGTLAGLAATYGEMAGSMTDEDKDHLVGAIAMATSRSVFSSLWMSGVADFLEAIHDPQHYGQTYIQKNVGSLVPSGINQFTRLADPNMRDMHPASNDPVWGSVQIVANAIKARIPGYSKTLPPEVNMWGVPVHYQGALGPDIASPIFTQEDMHYPIDDFLTKNQVAVSSPERSRDNVKMTPEEYHKFKVLAGNEYKDPVTGMGTFDMLNALVTGKLDMSDEFAQQTDGREGMKAYIVKNIIQNQRTGAWISMTADDISPHYDPVLAKKVQDATAEANKKKGFEAP